MVEPACTIGGRRANDQGETGGHLGLAAAHLTALIRRGPRHSFRADRRCLAAILRTTVPGDSTGSESVVRSTEYSVPCSLPSSIFDAWKTHLSSLQKTRGRGSGKGIRLMSLTAGSLAGGGRKRRTSTEYGVHSTVHKAHKQNRLLVLPAGSALWPHRTITNALVLTWISRRPRPWAHSSPPRRLLAIPCSLVSQNGRDFYQTEKGIASQERV